MERRAAEAAQKEKKPFCIPDPYAGWYAGIAAASAVRLPDDDPAVIAFRVEHGGGV